MVTTVTIYGGRGKRRPYESFGVTYITIQFVFTLWGIVKVYISTFYTVHSTLVLRGYNLHTIGEGHYILSVVPGEHLNFVIARLFYD